jgi:hypothetical protein
MQLQATGASHILAYHVNFAHIWTRAGLQHTNILTRKLQPQLSPNS